MGEFAARFLHHCLSGGLEDCPSNVEAYNVNIIGIQRFQLLTKLGKTKVIRNRNDVVRVNLLVKDLYISKPVEDDGEGSRAGVEKESPSSMTPAGGSLEFGSNILARRLSGHEVSVALVVSKWVPPTFNLTLPYIIKSKISETGLWKNYAK